MIIENFFEHVILVLETIAHFSVGVWRRLQVRQKE